MTDSEPNPAGQPPELIVDSDWKAEAQKEKQRLAEESSAKAPGGASGMPETLKFEDLVKMLASQALSYLGAYPDPQTGKAMVALDVAKLHIDLLGTLEDKTKGNLTEEEEGLLKQSLSDLRMIFVETSKAVQQAVAEGQIPDPSASPGPGMPPGSPPIV